MAKPRPMIRLDAGHRLLGSDAADNQDFFEQGLGLRIAEMINATRYIFR